VTNHQFFAVFNVDSARYAQTLEHGKNRVSCVCACVTHTHEHDTQKHEIFVCTHEITHEKHEIFRVCTQFHTRNTKISCMRFFKKMSEHLKK